MTHHEVKLQVIFKTAERCNLACTYCYYFFLGDDSFKDRPGTTSRATIVDLASFLSSNLTATNIKAIDIAFHGGEPMLQKVEDFEFACSTIRSALNNNVDLRFLIQTNGALVNDRWIDAFAKHHVLVGISLDGPPEYHDLYRVDKRGRGSYERTVRGLKRLQNAYIDGRLRACPATISVVSPEFDYTRIYRHLTRDLKLQTMSFLLPDVSRDGLVRDSTPEDYGAILSEIFDNWVADVDAGNDIYIVQFAKLLTFFKNHSESARLRAEQNRPIRRTQIIVVQSNGDITIDDSLMVALDWRLSFKSPNIREITLPEYLAQPVLEEVELLKNNGSIDCIECKYFGVCRSGDLENRYSKADGFARKSVYCGGLYQFLEHVAEYLLSNGYPDKGLENKLQLAKSMIDMNFLGVDSYRQSAPLWQA